MLCTTFLSKKIAEPIKPYSVSSKCWETIAAKLFGPMLSSKHQVVVQDLCSRFPAAKFVSLMEASKVLAAFGSIYNTYGNPKQISYNGPPFNSHAMRQFAAVKNIQMQQIPPLHQSPT